MLYWYQDLYMDQKVAKRKKKCQKRILARKPWKKSYYVITLSSGEGNLFDIMETRQLFFRRFNYLDLYVVAIAANYDHAISLLQNIIEDVMRSEGELHPREFFVKEKFERNRM